MSRHVRFLSERLLNLLLANLKPLSVSFLADFGLPEQGPTGKV